MPAGQRPLIRRRLRTELRQERERAGKSQAEVARKMDWSLSKIIRLEAGQVGVSTNDLKALLDLYDVQDQDRRSFFVELARASRQQSAWWSAFRDVASSPDYLDYLGYETDAARILGYFPAMVPALLQTEEYAREIVSIGGIQQLDEDTVDRLVELRMQRKEHVLDRKDPPTFVAVLDEAVLHHTVGGGEVMSDQLASVAEVAALSTIEIRVVPFSSGAHPGLSGPFQIFEFSDPADAPILQSDTAFRSVMLREERDLIREYTEGFDRLLDFALSERESVAMIQGVADRVLGDDTESN
ncbi:transcriptional regulator [Actinocatenispora thailandica]|uniref:Transcriptional regulator n=1 Tax=Actinocatenispora thailandica TaxID=227318 RepID=A0A7R7HUU2_9ACTN|nr:helix-turn-helix transcriptional regulator [Actinocatenispora thailandica]BCJ33003.1 transcriptional regulator [Actinocatenispora thailandica]